MVLFHSLIYRKGTHELQKTKQISRRTLQKAKNKIDLFFIWPHRWLHAIRSITRVDLMNTRRLLLDYEYRFYKSKQKIGRYFMTAGFVIGLVVGVIL